MGADLGWFALNVGDGHGWSDWAKLRQTAARNGVTVYAWRRCWNEDGLRALLDVALANAVQPLPNLETELEGALPSALVRQVCDEYPVVVAGWSFMGWLQNSVDFAPLAEQPALLQLFATDMRRDPADLPDIQRDCVEHARDKGFTYVGVTFQTYGDAEPDWYAYHGGVRSLYTGDDVGAGNWAQWRP